MPNYERALWADGSSGSKPSSNNPNPLVWKGKTYTDVDSYRRAIEASGASGVAKSDPIGEAAIFGGAAYAVKNPMHVLEMVGAVSTDAKNFSDIQQDLLSRKGTLNPVRKVKNIGRGLKRVGNVIGDIVNPRQVEVAGAPGLRINPGDVANPNVMQIRSENAMDPFRQTQRKRYQERSWAEADNLKIKPTDPSWDLPKNQLDDLEELVSDWSREQADILRKTGMSEADVAKTIKNRITKEWTNTGIELDGEAFRLGQGNINEVLQPDSTSRLKLKSKTALDARALGSDPVQDPAVQQFFKRAHKQGALDPEFTLESYGKYVKEGAAWSDRVTVDMAKHFGGSKAKQNAISDWTMKSGALDKEHAWSIALKGSNDFLSQFFGSRMLNRSQGKLNSFTRDTMRILGAPSNNLESAANWTAEQMSRKYNKTFYNPAQKLMPSDWLRVQDAFARVPPGASKHIQEEVAMKVLREREIITAWHKADLGSDPKSIEALTAYMEKIWEIDVPKSKLILDRTIGEQAFKKVMKEMYGKNPKVPRWKGKTIVQPGAKIDEKAGRLRGIVREGGGRIQPKETLTILKRDEAAQRYEYVKSTLDRLDEMDTTSNPFGLSEMQDRI